MYQASYMIRLTYVRLHHVFLHNPSKGTLIISKRQAKPSNYLYFDTFFFILLSLSSFKYVIQTKKRYGNLI